MNGGPEHASFMRPNQEANEKLVGMFLQPPERVEAFRTVQVADYSRSVTNFGFLKPGC